MFPQYFSSLCGRHSGWLEMIKERGIIKIKEFVHTIRKRFHEVEATGTETVYLLHVFLFPMLSSFSLGSQFDNPLYTDSPLPFSFDKPSHLVASNNGFSLQIYSFRLYGKHFLFPYIIVFVIIPRWIYNLNGDLTYSTSSADFLNRRVYKIKLILVNKCFIHFLLHCFCTVLFLTTNRNYLKKLTLMKAVLKNVVSCICPSVTFELQLNQIGWVDYTNLLALQAKKSNTGIRFIYSFPLG